MTKLEKFKQLRDELAAAYQTVLNSEHTKYDRSTVEYAKRCADDAEKGYRKEIIESEIKNEF